MTLPASFVTRFAPSPTGRLHLGHAYSAMVIDDAARAADGRLILRIDDIDTTRCRPEYEAAIIEDLDWLDIGWPPPLIRQSARRHLYEAALGRLQAMGVVYECRKTRAQLSQSALSAPHGPEPVESISFTCSAPPALRLSLERCREVMGDAYDQLVFETQERGRVKARPEINGDIVLGRKDIGTAYHLASVVDDADMGISHVIRGTDLFEATHVQVLLQALLGFPTPVYIHHRLVGDDQGQRLAKRKGSMSLKDYRDQGLSVTELRAMMTARLI